MEKDLEKWYELIKNKVLNSNEKLSQEELQKLRNYISKKELEKAQKESDILKLGSLIDYNDLKIKGRSKEDIQSYYQEDKETIRESMITQRNLLATDRNYMFGYPANMAQDSYVTSYLRSLESKLCFMNSCGNAYGSGNYRMSNNIAELEIIDIIKNNLDLPDDEYWGYISMGGTESNLWGIREGFSKYGNGILYYCDNSHYSISKAVDMLRGVKCQKISSINKSINTDELFSQIKENYEQALSPAIIILTYGTTTFGSVDDVQLIKRWLVENNIPHYIHLDAALYGGIPKNQIDKPVCNIGDLQIDSIAISLHKYLGNTKTNGVLLSKSKLNQTFIDYIGQQDITLLGSRDIYPFSTLQRTKEIVNRSSPFEYKNTIKKFEYLLEANSIKYTKGAENGNIFVIEKPSDATCSKYQLATFEYEGNQYAHIIIFPYHKEVILEELIKSIKDDYYLQKKRMKRN